MVDGGARSAPENEEKAGARKKAGDLCRMAVDDAATENERHVSAQAAAKLIVKHDLLTLPPLPEPDPFAGYPNPFGANGRPPPDLQAAFWQAEAIKWQAKLATFATSMHLILRNRRVGLATEVGPCVFCPKQIRVDDMIVWHRRRVEAAHYICCVMEIERRAREEPVAGGVPVDDEVDGPSPQRPSASRGRNADPWSRHESSPYHKRGKKR